jgi:PAN domain
MIAMLILSFPSIMEGIINGIKKIIPGLLLGSGHKQQTPQPQKQPVGKKQAVPVGQGGKKQVIPPPKQKPITGRGKQSVQNRYGYYRVLNSDIPHVGGQHSHKNNVTEAQCAKYCDDLPACNFYNYDPSARICKLKSFDSAPGVSLGVKGANGIPNVNDDKYIDGDQIADLKFDIEKDCLEACQRNTDCHWYAYEQKTKECALNKAKYKKGMIYAQK